MNSLLYRLGRAAARRPWTVIGLWALVAVLVIVSSNLFGAETEDSFDAPGVDSAIAIDLLSESGSDRAGLTARVVAATDVGFESPDARSELTIVRERLAALPEVIAVDETIAPSIIPDSHGRSNTHIAVSPTVTAVISTPMSCRRRTSTG